MERGVQGTAWVFLESRVPLGSPRRRLREYEGRSRMSDAVCSVLFYAGERALLDLAD